MSSCNNLASLKNRAPSSEIFLSDPSVGTGGSFRLNTVLPSQQSPGTLYDLVGQDSEFDTFCSDMNGPCICEYAYTSPGIGSVSVQGAVQYQESNLIRCVNSVPSGVNSFEVKVLASGLGYSSNIITVNLNSGTFANSTNYIDLSKEQAYQQVKRFQCRRRENIVNPYSKNMIDPIQSEDPKIIYPFNYYTTNVANSLWNMQQQPSQDWDCSLTPTYNRTLHWWSNPIVFSASACTEPFCAGDGEMMYPDDALVSGKIRVTNPAANGKRRGSFYLAKQSYGVFQIPVVAAVGPIDYVRGTYSPIGYAARPIPKSGGSSSCPNITLPSNSRWVKLWNFRATDITPPKVVTGSTTIDGTYITCNTTPGFFPSCDNDSTKSNPSNFTANWLGQTLSPFVGPSPAPFPFPTPGATPWPSTTSIASRVVAMTSGNVNACYNIVTMGDGREEWEPSPFAFSSPVTLQNMQDLPWNIYKLEAKRITVPCGDGFQYVDHTGSGTVGCPGKSWRMVFDQPSDSVLTTRALNSTSSSTPGDNFTDQIFVVTDPEVDDGQMRVQGLAVSQYKPVTYRTSTDCIGPTRANCSVSKEIHWDINVKDVGSANGADQYPLCVLQFYD